jgi:8-oxo-dGTP pyrophosphatase MutT (NUDIX family)
MEELNSEIVFDSPYFDVARKRFRRADGSEVDRYVVMHPGAVAILAHDDEVVYLVRQPREAVCEDGSLEIPAGTLDVEGESELDCARRELSEEVGLAAEHWTSLHEIYPSPGYVNERLTIFEATGLSEKPGEADDDEDIEVVRFPLARLDDAIAEIEDAKTLTGLFLLRQKLRG